MPSSTKPSLLEHPRIFGVIALVTGALLLLPLLAMQFTDQVRWGPSDFAVMAVLLMGGGAGWVLLARRLARRWRWLATVVVALLVAWVWAELAVGVFTGLGS